MQSMIGIAEDASDPPSQKSAFNFLGRCVTIWAAPPQAATVGPEPVESIPGFEGFVYERLVPTAFRVPAAPDLNVKDGQVTLVRLLGLPSWFIGLNSIARFCKKLPTSCTLSLEHEARRLTTTS